MLTEGGWRREEFSLRELLYILWSRKVLVLAVTALVTAAVAVYTFSGEPAYTAEAQVAIVPERPNVSQLELESFVEGVSIAVAADDELLAEAANRSGWDAGPAAFRDALDPVYHAGNGRSGGVEVRFTASDPGMAARGANAYADLLTERVATLEGQGISEQIATTAVTVTDRAEPGEVGQSGRPVLHLVAALLLGLLAGGVAATALDARTRSWRDARDAELTLRAPVLGTIPDYGPSQDAADEAREEERV